MLKAILVVHLSANDGFLPQKNKVSLDPHGNALDLTKLYLKILFNSMNQMEDC